MSIDGLLPLPPDNKMTKVNPVYFSLPARTEILRLSSLKHSTSLFNLFGPANRFDCHPAGPYQAHSPDFGVSYLGSSLKSCITETCLSSYQADHIVNGYLDSGRMLVWVQVTVGLDLLDLSGDGPVLAGTRIDILDEYQQRSITQEWARRFYLNPFGEYRPIDGIRWQSAKNREMVYVLYARSQPKVRVIRKIGVMTKDVRTDVMRICRDYRIVIAD